MVLLVNVGSPAAWQEGTILCEQSVEVGPFPAGRSYRLSEVPGIANVLVSLLGTTR
ncbi:MAG: hypothetical protein L3K14_05660 [Thermoplasmata archaeon]|nr:hypothetical protein [Thermoplasmata archaeon]